MNENNQLIASLPKPEGCSTGYGGCTCACHSMPGVKHIMPCCYPELVAPTQAAPCRGCELSVGGVCEHCEAAALHRKRMARLAQPCVSEQDERALFEKDALTRWNNDTGNLFERAGGGYAHPYICSEWNGWKARAALAQGAQAAQGDGAELVAAMRDRVTRIRYIDESSRKLLIQAADFIVAAQGGGVQAEPVAWMTQWLRDNYQDYPSIASLCDAVRNAWGKKTQQPAAEWKCPTCGQGQRFDHRGCRPFGWWNVKYHLFTPASQLSSGEPIEHSPAYVRGELTPLYAARPAPSAAPAGQSEHTVDDRELAGRIMLFLGHAASGSMEPGADPLADRLAEKLAQWSAAAPAQVAQGQPVAYLHQVVCGDGDPDQALSFAPDNFPLADTLGYRSIGHQPLYLAAPVAPSQPQEDAHIVSVLSVLVDKVRNLDDCGPYGEGWQSQEPEEAIAQADAIIATREEGATNGS